MEENTLEFVSGQLHKKGMRMTEPRKEALEFFVSEHRLRTPQELHLEMSDKGIKIGLTTVYRMVNCLMELGLSRNYSIDGELRYIFCPPNHHHHLICLKCLRVEDIYDCPVKDVKIENFEVKSHRLDFFGICEECKN